MIIVTGKTFDHRETLQSYGGSWNNADRRWEFRRLSSARLANLKTTVGLVVTTEQDAIPSDDDDDWIERLIANAGSDHRPGLTKTKLYGNDPTYHNHFADKEPAAFFGFDSLSAFTAYIGDLKPNNSGSGWETDMGEFSGSASMNHALSIARQGWQDGAQRAADVLERMSLANPRVKRRRASLAGGSVSVGRMLAGDPAHMIRRPKQPGRKVVTFFVEAGCLAVIRPKHMITRAALIGAIADLMENAGYSCAIVATDTSTHKGRPMYQLAVTLKEAGERLNVMDVIFGLGHPSFLRRFSFAACSSANECRDIWSSQGMPSNAFDNSYPTGSSEFYIPVLTASAQSRIDDDPLSMLEYVIPSGLPIEIGTER